MDEAWRDTKPGSRAGRKVKHPNDMKKPAQPKTNPLAEVYRDTQRLCASMTCTESDLLRLEDVAAVPALETPRKTQYTVRNEDTLDMAARFVGMGLNPLVLNMASAFKAGGGVARGARAQEEDLFRRTTACLTHPPEWYPLAPDMFIYSPRVTVVKDADHNPVADGPSFAMIAMPALSKPKLRGADYRLEADRDLMQRKVDAIFQTAIKYGHDSLVLGALGCGAYANPPEAVCPLFQRAAAAYGAHFSHIGFAVLVVQPRDGRNLEVFQGAFAPCCM